MKSGLLRISALLFVALLLSACSDDKPQTPEQAEKMKLFNLARMHGCMECHRINATVVGPSWEAISERYKDAPFEAARDMLVDSVMNGSQGKWLTWKGGNGMDPLARRVDKQVVIELSEYILKLKRPASPAVPVSKAP